MADLKDPETGSSAAEDETPSEEVPYGIEPGFENDVIEALAGEQEERVRDLVTPLHYADVADLLQRLSPEERRILIRYIAADFDPDTLAELDDTVREEIFSYLRPEELAVAVAGLDIDDAVNVIEEMDEDDQRELLESIPAEERTLIEEGLAYPEDSAGRLMQREYVAVPGFWTVGETIDFMRRGADHDGDPLPAVFYDIFVTDPAHRPLGMIPLARLLRTKRPVPVEQIMDREMKVVEATTDQEDVAFLFRQRDLVSAPVVDDSGRLVGAVTIDDVVDVIDEEHEEDFMRLGGVIEDDLYSAAIDTTRSRFTWLLVNLGTAILASLVIGLFEATLEQIVALAVLMPIVASMGGNAGTQTLTVAVRALATKELTPTNAGRIIGKELLVGGFNGVLFAVLTGIVAWLWFGSPAIGMVIGLAMVVNMVVAGLAGTTIPLLLERLGVDPAVASSVFLTTVTDVVGFFAFLGLAALVLL